MVTCFSLLKSRSTIADDLPLTAFLVEVRFLLGRCMSQTFSGLIKPRSFQAGSQVLLLLQWKKNKLEMAWRGPYRVEERVGPCDYRIMIGGKAKLFHANLLKRYVSRGDGQVSVLVVEEQDEWEPVITTAERVPTVP